MLGKAPYRHESWCWFSAARHAAMMTTQAALSAVDSIPENTKSSEETGKERPQMLIFGIV